MTLSKKSGISTVNTMGSVYLNIIKSISVKTIAQNKKDNAIKCSSIED